MASLGASSPLDYEPLIRTIKDGGLINKTLQVICASEGMNKTGVKAELQNRIIESTSFAAAASQRSFPVCFPTNLTMSHTQY